MIANVHFEFLAQPATFPVGKEISIIVKVRTTAKVNVAHQHSAKMADVAHSIARGSNRSEKLDSAHHEHKDPHGHGDRQREHPDLPVRHHNRHCQQHAVDRAGRSNRRYQSCTASMRIDQKVHDDINDSRAYPAHEKIGVKPTCAPAMFQVSAEHRQVQQVEKNVKNGTVKENVGKRLPDSETAYDRPGAESKPAEPKPLARFVKQQRRNRLQKKN